jgi:hypothetical protein
MLNIIITCCCIMHHQPEWRLVGAEHGTIGASRAIVNIARKLDDKLKTK